jgi:putative SOS response-associated peptidase YedK
MCGRFAVKKKPKEIADDIEALWAEYDADLEATFNAAPTDKAALLVDDKLELQSWGLVPSWSNDSAKRASMINARSESILEKPAFKDLVGKRQCILPCHGYFEWQVRGDKKIPHYFFPEEGEYLFLAALWDLWHDSQAKPIKSFTIMTQEAAESIAGVHHRMPIMLDLEQARLWTKNELSVGQALEKSHCRLSFHQVSTEVNSVRHNSPSLIEPTTTPVQWQDDLF